MLQFIFKMQWTFHWWFCLSIKPYGLAWRFYFFVHLVGSILINFICFVYDVGCVPWNVFYWVLFRFTHFNTFCSSLVETQSSTKQSRVRHINHASVHDLWASKYNIFQFLSPCAVSCVAVVSVNWFDFMVFSDCLTCSRLNFGVGTVAWTLQKYYVPYQFGCWHPKSEISENLPKVFAIHLWQPVKELQVFW